MQLETVSNRSQSSFFEKRRALNTRKIVAKMNVTMAATKLVGSRMPNRSAKKTGNSDNTNVIAATKASDQRCSTSAKMRAAARSAQIRRTR